MKQPEREEAMVDGLQSADAAAALDVVSALSRKAVEWRRADAAGARAFGAVCVAASGADPDMQQRRSTPAS